MLGKKKVTTPQLVEPHMRMSILPLHHGFQDKAEMLFDFPLHLAANTYFSSVFSIPAFYHRSRGNGHEKNLCT